MSSQSEFEMIFSFVGTDKSMVGEVVRLQAPLIVQSLLEKAPFSCRTRANIGNPKSYWILMVDIKRGQEKTGYKGIKVGDILYCPKQDSLFIIYETPWAPITDNVYYVGRIKTGLENLKTMRNGIMCRIDFKETQITPSAA